MSRKVLLTGATGFVGRQVLKYLQKSDGFELIIVARPGWKNSLRNLEGIIDVIETEDLFNESVDWWVNSCENVEIIIHAAWYAEPGRYLSSDKNIDCLTGTLNLARGALLAGVHKVVGIGTCIECDLTGGVLFPNTSIKPETLYAAAKASSYLMLSNLFKKEDVKFTWCRLFYLYGEGEDKRRLYAYIRERLEKNQTVELTSGNQIRDFLDVKDAARMIVDVSISDTNGIVNICSGIPITVRQFAEGIADLYGKRHLLKFGMRADNAFDPSCVVGIRTSG